MRVLDLLRQVYREIWMLETSRRQKDMIIADNAGVKAIRYDKDKVSGGQQDDLADVLLNIEREQERINEQIARQLERVMRHRAELYQLMEKVPDGPGKAAVQEHYLYHVPWGGVAERLHYGKDYTRKSAYRCVELLEAIWQEEDLKSPEGK